MPEGRLPGCIQVKRVPEAVERTSFLRLQGCCRDAEKARSSQSLVSNCDWGDSPALPAAPVPATVLPATAGHEEYPWVEGSGPGARRYHSSRLPESVPASSPANLARSSKGAGLAGSGELGPRRPASICLQGPPALRRALRTYPSDYSALHTPSPPRGPGRAELDPRPHRVSPCAPLSLTSLRAARVRGAEA